MKKLIAKVLDILLDDDMPLAAVLACSAYGAIAGIGAIHILCKPESGTVLFDVSVVAMMLTLAMAYIALIYAALIGTAEIFCYLSDKWDHDWKLSLKVWARTHSR
jgi:hypothetical protein